MYVIICPKCDDRMSEHSETCPRCGYPIRKVLEDQKKYRTRSGTNIAKSINNTTEQIESNNSTQQDGIDIPPVIKKQVVTPYRDEKVDRVKYQSILKICMIFMLFILLTVMLYGLFFSSDIESDKSLAKETLPPENEWIIPFTPINFDMSLSEIEKMLGQANAKSDSVLKYSCDYLDNNGDLTIYHIREKSYYLKKIEWNLKGGGDKETSEMYLDTLKTKYGEPYFNYGVNTKNGTDWIYFWHYYWVKNDYTIDVVVCDGNKMGNYLTITFYEPNSLDMTEIVKNANNFKKYKNR